MDAAARIEALEAEVARLRERIAQLEAIEGPGFTAPPAWRLTSSETRVLACLMARELATKDALMTALYRDEGREEPELKIVDVFVCKLRKKLAPLDIGIETVWGRGYQMSAGAKARVRAALSPAGAP